MANFDNSIANYKAQISNAEKRWNNNQEQINLAMREIVTLRAGGRPNWSVMDSVSRLQRRLESLDLTDDAAALADGAKLDFNPAERIINQSQLSSIKFFEMGLVAARTVARVKIMSSGGAVAGFGTGFMISPSLFMTNNHVLTNKEQSRRSVVEFEYVNSVGGLRDPIVFTLRPDLFFQTNDPLDYTIVAVESIGSDKSVVSKRGWSPLISGSGKATVGERVNIVQHPGGERMQIAVRDNTVVQAKNTKEFLHYVADTQPGSSGSPVYNDQWQLAALHHAGVPKKDNVGNILLKNGQIFKKNSDAHRIDWIANEGIRVSAIVAHVKKANLSQEQRRLWQEVFTPPPIKDVWSLLTGSIPIVPDIDPFENNTDPMQFQTDKNGNASWLFRLSFGPVGSEGTGNSVANTPGLSAPPIVDSSDTSGQAEDAGMEAAKRLFEQFGHEGVYYDDVEDAVEDAGMRDAYYNGIDLQEAAARLFPKLTELLEETHSPRLSYPRARHEFLYPAIDVRENGKLQNIYAGDMFDPVEAMAMELSSLQTVALSRGIEADFGALETLLDNDDLWEALELEETARLLFNCEHVVCQSWFDKKQPMKADIHHLFACRPNCNSFRNNIPYWQFPPEDEGFMQDCGRTDRKIKFEPKTGKGAVARATLYFLVRYPGMIGDSKGELTKSRLPTLLQWHQEFPVDEYELHRNWLIEKAQGNRNPFIDFPELTTRALLEQGFGRR